MFEVICVSGRNRRPWTVVASFAGQAAVVGLAVLVPLMSTERLPRFAEWVSVPEPPHALTRPRAQAQPKPARTVPFQMAHRLLEVPTAIPPRAQMIQDTELPPAADNGPGVPGGIPDAGGGANRVIDTFVKSLPALVPPAPPAPAKEAPKPVPRIHVSSGVQRGKLISGPLPVYPELARRARIAGVVRLQAVISRDGTILDLRAVSGHPMLVPAALAAVSHWIFSPTYLNADPVEVATDIEVNFTLQ